MAALKRDKRFVIFFGIALNFALVSSVSCQDNYEIQVYPTETVSPGTLMIELHSNFTFQGEEQTTNGVRPTEHALHETVELITGSPPGSRLNLSPDWEFNFGAAIGVTRATDRFLAKMIVGRRFNF